MDKDLQGRKQVCEGREVWVDTGVPVTTVLRDVIVGIELVRWGLY